MAKWCPHYEHYEFLDEQGELTESAATLQDAISSCTLGVDQYTGLKDRNGVEIFEGDIIQDDVGTFYVVSWESYFCQFVRSQSIGGNCSDLIKDEMSEGYFVIGNIHESPELLEG